MKHCLLGICLVLIGCTKPFVKTPVPEEPLVMEEAAVANGVLMPQDLSFTLVSQYKNSRARVVILMMPAVKVADMTVSANEIQLHEKARQIPGALVKRWGRLAQAYFLSPCPQRRIKHRFSAPTQIFELEVTGGICQ